MSTDKTMHDILFIGTIANLIIINFYPKLYIIRFLISLINKVLFYVLPAHIILDKYYPVQYKAFLIKAAHIGLTIYSKLQIILDKKYKDMKKNNEFSYFVWIHELLKQENPGNIEIIHNGETIIYTTVDKLSRRKHDLMDFMIFSDKQPDNKTNKVIYFDIPNNFSYQKCSYKFISTTITFSESESYSLKLSGDKDNYFISNNHLNTFVFCYLVRKHYGVIKDETLAKYKLEIIDHNANIVTLTEEDEILLQADKYTILRAGEESEVSSLSENQGEDLNEIDELAHIVQNKPFVNSN